MAETSDKEYQHAVKYSKEAEDRLLEIDEELTNMVQGSKETSKWKETAIFRVPAYVSNRNPTAYCPRVVSLGPYHHGEIHLRPMEEHKRRAVVNYLRRSKKTYHVLCESFHKEVDDLKDSYDQLDDQWSNEKFLELMILDGCFMFEIFLAAYNGSAHYDHGDPIFSRSGLLINSPYIKRDMLMLENQLPIRVLKILFAESNDYDNGNSDLLYLYIRTFFFGLIGHPGQRKDYSHVLDLHRHCLVYRNNRNPTAVNSSFLDDNEDIIRFAGRLNDGGVQFEGLIRSATRLNEAGIQFEMLKAAGLGFGDGRVRFESGVLKLPVINLDEGSESMFLNLTAFERVYMRTEPTRMDVTSYILFMDNLIDNEKDVALLRSKGIIRNISGSDKAVAELFKSLSKDLILPPAIGMLDVRDEINEYCEKRWNEWHANLIHTYFSNPWVTLSVIAAVLLFTFTILQTTYTILPYHRK